MIDNDYAITILHHSHLRIYPHLSLFHHLQDDSYDITSYTAFHGLLTHFFSFVCIPPIFLLFPSTRM